MRIGRVIREARLAAGISQTRLADDMGIPSWTLNRLEMGHRTFDQRWLPLLPAAIRGPVVRALEDEYRLRLDRMREDNRSDEPIPIRRGNGRPCVPE